MIRNLSLECWVDETWYVGRLKEVPGVFSQGESLEELEENIKEAYQLIMEDDNYKGINTLKYFELSQVPTPTGIDY